jgi:hypothetical protein
MPAGSNLPAEPGQTSRRSLHNPPILLRGRPGMSFRFTRIRDHRTWLVTAPIASPRFATRRISAPRPPGVAVTLPSPLGLPPSRGRLLGHAALIVK